MAATTTPDGIAYPTLTDQGDDLAVLFANLANTTQTAITNLRNSIPTTITNTLASHKGIPKSSYMGSTTKAGPFNAGASYSHTITFPSGQFTTAPKVIVQSSRSRINIGVTATTATTATLLLENWSEGNEPNGITITYYAVQET